MSQMKLTESRTSLTSNSSKQGRIVRKRDANYSNNSFKTRSKSKNDQQQTNFAKFVTSQSQIISIQNMEPIYLVKHSSLVNESKEQRNRVKPSNIGTALRKNFSSSSIQSLKNSLIQNGNRYIDTKSIEKQTINQRKGKEKEEKKQKKRQATPVKSKKQLTEKKAREGQDSKLFFFQLKANCLEEELQTNRKRVAQLQKDKLKIASVQKQTLQKLVAFEQSNKELKIEINELQEKIKSLERSILQSQSNLATAQSNLSKLKQTIKENKLIELQQQIKKLAKQNTLLKQKNAANIQTIDNLADKMKQTFKLLKDKEKELERIGSIETIAIKQSMKEKYLEKQLEKLKKQFMEYRNRDSNLTEQFLEINVKEKDKTIMQLQEQVSALSIKVHCLEYFKSKQIQELRKSFQTETKSLRMRYSKLVVDYKLKKRQSFSEINNQNIKVVAKSPTHQSSSPKKQNIYNSKANSKQYQNQQAEPLRKSLSPKKKNLFDDSIGRISETERQKIVANIKNNMQEQNNGELTLGDKQKGQLTKMPSRPTSISSKIRAENNRRQYTSAEDDFQLQLSPQ